MNTAVLLGGVLGTVLLILFVVEWIWAGIGSAFAFLGFLAVLIASIVGLILFWAWVAGGFA